MPIQLGLIVVTVWVVIATAWPWKLAVISACLLVIPMAILRIVGLFVTFRQRREAAHSQ